MANTCSECDRLWRCWGALTQMQFRLEEILRQAELRQDHDLINALNAKLGYLVQDQERISRALTHHQVTHNNSAAE